MATMTHERFKEILRKLNPRLYLITAKTFRASMVYYDCNDHPDANENGMIEIAAVPSKHTVDRIPDKNFIDGHGLKSRGYIEFFRKLTEFRVSGVPIVNKWEVKRLVPDLWKSPGNPKPTRDVWAGMKPKGYDEFPIQSGVQQMVPGSVMA